MMAAVRRLAAIVLVTAATAPLVGCGETQPDLFAVRRDGGIPGAKLSLVVNDAGTATCNGRRHPLPDPLLLQARQLQRDLRKPVKAGLSLPARPGSVLRYQVRGQDGMLSFADNSRGQQPALFRLAEFVRVVAKGVCRLAR
jgi:hypothetical protein